MINNKQELIILNENETIDLVEGVRNVNINIGKILDELKKQRGSEINKLEYIQLRELRKSINILKIKLDKIID